MSKERLTVWDEANNEQDFNAIVEEEKELAEMIECIVAKSIKRNFGGLPENFECFLQINGDGVSLVSCG